MCNDADTPGHLTLTAAVLRLLELGAEPLAKQAGATDEWALWADWATTCGVSPLPADSDALQRWLTSLGVGEQLSASLLAGVTAVHRLAGYPDPVVGS